MRPHSTASLTIALLFVTAAAQAQYADHRLIAYAHSTFGPPGSVKDVGLPDTSTLAEFSVDAQPGALLISNRAHVDSDTGAIRIATKLADVTGGGYDPNEWNLYAGLEEKVSRTSANKTGLKVKLTRPIDLAAAIQTASTGLLTMRTVLEVKSAEGASCRGSFTQQFAGPGVQPPPPPGVAADSCPYPPQGWSLLLQDDGIAVDMPDMGTHVWLMAYYQIEMESLSNIQSLEAEMDGALTMTATGGGVVGKSVTFLTKGSTPPPPSPTNDGGSSGTTPVDAPDAALDFGGPPSASPAADDGGCNAAGAPGVPLGAGLLGVVVAIGLRGRRRSAGSPNEPTKPATR